MEARGEEVGAMATFRVMKSTLGRMQREMMVERQRLAALHGNIYDDMKKAASAEMGGGAAGGEAGGLPMVRPGDASVAAPFTSRAPSVHDTCTRANAQGIRTGRAALHIGGRNQGTDARVDVDENTSARIRTMA